MHSVCLMPCACLVIASFIAFALALALDLGIAPQRTMDRAVKLQRLDDFRRRVPYVSASALEAILREAQHDIPEIVDRDSMREARDIKVNEKLEYGTLLHKLTCERTDGSTADLTIISPFAMLYMATLRCEGFAQMLKRALHANPPSYEHPWRLIIYSDEVVPGNAIAAHNMRKLWVLYWSFMEFGPALLSDEDAWFCIGAERTDRVKQLEGGMAQVFSMVLVFMFSSGGHSFKDSGVQLEFADGTRVRLFAVLEMILQDCGAHKQVFCVKGESGLKQCLGCRNFYAKDHGIVDEEADESLLTCSSVNPAELDFATDDEVRATVKRLAGFKLTLENKLFKVREVACGFNHQKFNMLLNPALDNVVRPVSNFAHDWMHTMVVTGAWNTVMYLLIMALVTDGRAKDAHQQIGAYVSLWTLPARVSGTKLPVADTFATSRWKSSAKAKHFKCSASEALSMYALVRAYIVMTFLRAGICVAQCQAYVACCDVLDLLTSQMHGCVRVSQFKAAVDNFLRACVDAGWADYLHPKFHWTIHLVLELQRFDVLLSCWVHERKHAMVLRYLRDIRNTLKYETSILSETTCHHLHELSKPSKFDRRVGLVLPIAPCKEKMAAFLRKELGGACRLLQHARRCRVSEFEVCTARDVVLLRGEPLLVGEVWFFAASDGKAFALVSAWATESKNDLQGTVTVRISDNAVELYSTEDILVSCAYRRKADGTAVVVAPWRFRHLL